MLLTTFMSYIITNVSIVIYPRCISISVASRQTEKSATALAKICSAKNASCRQSRQTARFHTTLHAQYGRRPQRIIINTDCRELRVWSNASVFPRRAHYFCGIPRSRCVSRQNYAQLGKRSLSQMIKPGSH